MSWNCMSCIVFMSCILVRHFHVLHIPVLQFGHSISYIWCIFTPAPRILMVRHFQVLHFQSTLRMVILFDLFECWRAMFANNPPVHPAFFVKLHTLTLVRSFVHFSQHDEKSSHGNPYNPLVSSMLVTRKEKTYNCNKLIRLCGLGQNAGLCIVNELKWFRQLRSNKHVDSRWDHGRLRTILRLFV